MLHELGDGYQQMSPASGRDKQQDSAAGEISVAHPSSGERRQIKQEWNVCVEE
jgi:hypothetical protein